MGRNPELPRGLGATVGSIARLRCPRCHEGAVYEGFFRYHEHCPTCGIRFAREPGYFLGAYYFMYGYAVALAAPVGIALGWLDVSTPVLGGALLIELALLAPLIVKYARVSWLHFDEAFDPRP